MRHRCAQEKGPGNNNRCKKAQLSPAICVYVHGSLLLASAYTLLLPIGRGIYRVTIWKIKGFTSFKCDQE